MKGRVQKKHMEKFDDLSPPPHTNIVSVWNKKTRPKMLSEKKLGLLCKGT